MDPDTTQPTCKPALPCTGPVRQEVSSINDKSDWKVVRKALTVIDFTEDEVEVRPSVRGPPFSSCHPAVSPGYLYSCFYSGMISSACLIRSQLLLTIHMCLPASDPPPTPACTPPCALTPTQGPAKHRGSVLHLSQHPLCK